MSKASERWQQKRQSLKSLKHLNENEHTFWFKLPMLCFDKE